MSEEQLGPQEQQNPQSGSTSFPPPNGGFPPQGGGFYGMQMALPNATAVLVLGILCILSCCCYGIVGTILGIIALVLAKKDRALYMLNAAQYTEASYKNLNAGRVCAIIGLILNGLVLLFYIILIATVGFAALSDPQVMREMLKGMQQ